LSIWLLRAVAVVKVVQ